MEQFRTRNNIFSQSTRRHTHTQTNMSENIPLTWEVIIYAYFMSFFDTQPITLNPLCLVDLTFLSSGTFVLNQGS